MTATATKPRQHVASIKIDDDLYGRIQRLADARQRTPHWMMKEAIKSYLDREEAQEELKQAALRSWQHYQETGLHLTGEEMDVWLARLEAGEHDAPMPQCHR